MNIDTSSIHRRASHTLTWANVVRWTWGLRGTDDDADEDTFEWCHSDQLYPMHSQTWTSRPELHSMIACPVWLDPLTCPYPPTSPSSFPPEPAPVFVYTNFCHIPPMHQKVFPFSTAWRPSTWITHCHLWYPQPSANLTPMARKINSRVWWLIAAKWMDPAKEEDILQVALELVFEDNPMPRREGDEDEGDEGGVFVRRRWEGECWVWVYGIVT